MRKDPFRPVLSVMRRMTGARSEKSVTRPGLEAVSRSKFSNLGQKLCFCVNGVRKAALLRVSSTSLLYIKRHTKEFYK